VDSTETIAPKPTLPPPPAPRPSEVKLRLECPECGTSGLFDVRNLNRKFRCPGCSNWWRTDTAGVLVPAAPESETVETVAEVMNKPRAPATTPVPALAAANGAAKTLTPAELWGPPAAPLPTPSRTKSSKSAPRAKAAPARTERESRLTLARLWLIAAAKSRAGRLALAGTGVVIVMLLGIAALSLFPSELRSRGQKAAQAWLAGDVEQIKQFVDTAQVSQVSGWLKQNPPPDVAGQQPAPSVHVAVQRNDGYSAEILIQIKAKKKDGTLGHYVYRQNWISRQGTWYLKPSIAAPRTSVRNGT
jgi:hypothetical protein